MEFTIERERKRERIKYRAHMFNVILFVYKIFPVFEVHIAA